MSVRRFCATTMVVPAAVLLLAAACSGGGDTTRGTVPAATTAPAAATTVTTSTTSTVTTDGTATPTAAPVTTAAAGVAPTVTGTTTADTDTTGTTGTTSGPTGTTETVTSTTGSGPTVPTTLPTTDDTTTPTTAATDTGDGTEPRNKVDEQYPLNSAERRAYLEVSGGIAPAGATVTLDLGPTGDSASQHGRTTADRWPNGYPAAPGSPNYETTTFAQRDAQRAARWVALMNRSGIDHYWLNGVPEDPTEPFPRVKHYGPATPEMELLRDYTGREYVDGAWGWVHDEQPPANVIWSHARWRMCGSWENTKRTDHANTGINTTPCDMQLDWLLFAFEHLVRDADTRPVEARARAMGHHWYVARVAYRPDVPAGENPLRGFSSTEGTRLNEQLRLLANDLELVEWTVVGQVGSEVSRHWDAEIAAGRKPWEQAAP